MSPSGDRLREIARRASTQGGRAAAAAMAREGRDEIRRHLARRGHPAGTPTPSPPGQPPARISGRLWESVIATMPVPAGAHRWVASAGPHGVVYARIQERGGVAGRGHRSVLPPRPYVAAAAAELRASGRLNEVASRAFLAAVHG